MTAYGPRDAVSILMDTGHTVSLRTPRAGDKAEQVRMTDGTTRRMTWVVDDRPVSRSQLEYAAARAAALHRADAMLAQGNRR